MSIQILNHGRVREIRVAPSSLDTLDSALCQALSAAVEHASEEVDGIVRTGSQLIFADGMDVPHLTPAIAALIGRAGIIALQIRTLRQTPCPPPPNPLSPN